jgi:hypothetical protein
VGRGKTQKIIELLDTDSLPVFKPQSIAASPVVFPKINLR